MEPGELLIKERIDKLNEIRSWKINPYPYSYDRKDFAKDILDKNSKLKAGEETKQKVKIAGRIISLRKMGKVNFADIQDFTGKVQFFVSKEEIMDQYALFNKLDIGDIIGVEGTIFKTKAGEISIKVKNIELLSKSIRSLPDKFHGIKDPEIKYRQRYADMIANPEVRDIFVKRSQIINAVREFLNSKGFIEVEIPMLQPVYWGAKAKPFKTHINAWNLDLYLSVSPELYLKRLIVGGFEKVYTICKNFRNEGVDKTHNPEFTMMECYQTYADYTDMMKLTEELYCYVAKKVLGTLKINYQGTEINLKEPWKKISMIDSIKEYAGIDIAKLNDKEIEELLRKNKIVQEGKLNKGLAIEALFDNLVTEKLIQPTFITDHPKETTPLCKVNRKNPQLIERFEPFINGWEIGNAYSELNDPLLQKQLLEEQAEQLKSGDQEAHPMDKDFIKAMEYGMPPTGGLGLGMDRLVMLLTDSKTIRDVIIFPTMKPENV